MIPLAKIANNLEIICVASAVSQYLKDLCSNKSIIFHIAVLKRGEVCPMPHARCPMPHAPCPMPHARRVPHVTEKGYIMSCKSTIIRLVERNKILTTNQ
jgi:hypothetical protein